MKNGGEKQNNNVEHIKYVKIEKNEEKISIE